MQSVSIIGVGRIGGALAIALSRAGYRIDDLVHRDPTTANSIVSQLPDTVRLVDFSEGSHRFESDIFIIATADPDIASVAGRLAGRLKDGSIVLHTSGSLSSEVLLDLAGSGCSTGSMHPLISVSDAVSGADNFSGAYFCIEGDSAAAKAAHKIVESLKGKSFSIASAQKSLYHAAAVMACGHLVALVDMAAEMLALCGVERASAKDVLMPLIDSTVANLETRSPARALTGSFARLDVEAVKRHLAAIDEQKLNGVREVYLLLGERSLELAASNGGSPADVEQIREVISIAKRKSG